MANQLKAELILDAKQAISSLNSFVSQAEGTLSTGGNKAGKSFGDGIKAGILGALSGFSIGAVLGQIGSNVGAYRDVAVANLSLTGAVKATNDRLAQQQKVLGSTTSSIEQKALALGVDTSKLYENVSATQASANATQGLERSLKIQTRALEDSLLPLQRIVGLREIDQNKIQDQIDVLSRQENASARTIKGIDKETQAIDNQISSIQANTNEKVKALRISLGGGDLDRDKNKLAIAKNNLEIKRDEAKLSGDLVSAKFLDLEIAKLADVIDLNKNKLDAINLQTDAIKLQDDTQINELSTQKQKLDLKKQEVQAQRDILAEQKQTLEFSKQEVIAVIKKINDEIKNNKAKFDIDIEPLKRKIEDIRDAMSAAGSGGTKSRVLNQDLVKQIEEQSRKTLNLSPTLQIDDKKIAQVTDNLVAKFGRTISKSDITNTLAELIQGGLSDAKQLEQIVERFVETSANSRVGLQNQGQALANLAQGFKTGQSSITEFSGLSENFASNIIPKGTNAMIEQALAIGDLSTAERLRKGDLTDQETAQAKLNGVLFVTQDTVGRYKNALDSGLLSQSELAQSTTKTSQILGKELTPAFAEATKFGNSLVKNFNDLLTNTPGLSLGLTGVALSLGLVTGALAILVGLFGSSTVIATIGVLVGNIGAFVGLIGTAVTTGGSFLGILGQIGTLIGVVINPVFLILAGVVAVAGLAFLAWNTNFLGIQDTAKMVFGYLQPAFDFLGQKIGDFVKTASDYITSFKDNWQTRIGEIIGFFLTLPIKLPILVLQAIGFIFEVVSKVNWGGLWSGILEGLKGAWEGVKSFFSNIDVGQLFRGIGNGFSDLVGGLLRGIGAGIPGSGAVIDPLIARLPRFATGGYVDGAGTGTSDSILAKLSKGEFVVNSKMTERYLPELSKMNSGNYSSNNNNQSYDQSTTNYNNYSSGSMSFGFNSKYYV